MHSARLSALVLLGLASALTPNLAADPSYHVIRTQVVGGAGGWDYVYADAAHRRLYVPRGDRITLFNLDTLAPAGTIPGTASVHGVAIDPVSRHAFSSSRPVLMWDAESLAVLKSIPTSGAPDGILFEPLTERVYILSHRAPNVTVLDGKDGSIVGTIDLGGEPEQAQSDGQGHVYIDLEDQDQVAVVDARALKVTGHYGLGGKGGGPGGLALDRDHGILFVLCHDPHTAVLLNAADGSIIDTLPIGSGVDAADFNPRTGECFSSQGDGTLTVIARDASGKYRVAQTVATQAGARTSTLDESTGHLFLPTAKFLPNPPATPGQPAPQHYRRKTVPGSFTLLEVGSD